MAVDARRLAARMFASVAEGALGLATGLFVPVMVLAFVEDHVIHRQTALSGLAFFLPLPIAATLALRRDPGTERWLFWLLMIVGSFVGAAVLGLDVASRSS